MSEFDIDDDNFGDDLDNIFGTEPTDTISTPKDKRSVVTGVLKDAAKAVKSDAKNMDKNVSDVLDKALPDQLSGITSGYSDAKDTLKDVYVKTTKEVRPKLSTLTTHLNKMVPEKMTGIKKFTNKLENALKGEDNGSSYQKRSLQDEIIDKLDGVLPKEDYSAREKIVNDQIALNRHKDNIGLLSEISTYSKAGFEFDRQRVAAYQRKHLELMYKSVYYQKHLYEAQNNNFDTLKSQLEAVVKNTGLPEVLKIKKTERFKELLRDDYLAVAQEAVFGNANWLDRGLKNLKSKLLGGVEAASGSLDMLTMGLEMQADLGDMLPPESLGTKIGGEASGIIRNIIAGKAKKALSKNQRASGTVNKISDLYRNAPSALEDYVNRPEGNENPLLSAAASGILSIIRPEGGNYDVNAERNVELDAPVLFDNKTHTSINMVIPGYLSKILSQVTAIRTGGDPEQVDYDYTKNKFMETNKLRRSIRAGLIKEVQASGVSYNIDTILNTVAKDLPPKDRALLKRRLINQITGSKRLDTRALNTNNVFEGLGEGVTKSFKDYEEYNPGAIQNRLEYIRSSLPNIKDSVAKLIEAGYEDMLIQEGIIIKHGNSYKLSITKYRKFLNLKPTRSSNGKLFNNKEIIEATEAATKKFDVSGVVKTAKDKLNRSKGYVKGIGANISDKYRESNLSSDVKQAYNTVGQKAQQGLDFIRNKLTSLNIKEQYDKLKSPKEREEFINSVSETANIAKDKVKEFLRSSEGINKVSSRINETANSVANKLDISERIQPVSDLTSSGKAKLDKAIKDHGLDKLTASGVIAAGKDRASTLVNFEALKDLGSNLTRPGSVNKVLNTANNIDITEAIQPISDLTTAARSKLDKAIKDHGLDELTASGVIAAGKDRASTLINFKALKNNITDYDYRGKVNKTINTASNIDISEQIQPISDLTTAARSRLDKAIKDHGLDKLTASGVIAAGKDRASTLINFKALKGFTSKFRHPNKDNATGNTSNDQGYVLPEGMSTKFDTHLEYMKALIGITTNISGQMDVVISGINSSGNSTDNKPENILKRSMNKMSGIFKSAGSGLGKLNPLNITKVLKRSGNTGDSKVNSILGGLTKIGGLIKPLYGSLLNPLQLVTNLATGVLGGLGSKLLSVPNMLKFAYKGLSKVNNKVIKSLIGDTNKVTDLYTKSNPDSPALKANAIKMGMYLDTQTGKVIHKLSDINGAVSDIEGNIVLTTSDIIDGLYDSKGNEVKVGAARKKGLIGKLGGMFSFSKLKGFKLPKIGMFKIKGRSIKLPGYKLPKLSAKEFGSQTNIIYNVYKETVNHTSLLYDIRELLAQSVTKGKWNDKNADGFRDNNWRERLRKLNKKEKKAEDKDKDNEKDKSFFSLSNILPSIISLLGGALTFAGAASGTLRNLLFGAGVGLSGLLGSIFKKLPGAKAGGSLISSVLKKLPGANGAGKIAGKVGLKSLSKKIPGIALLAGGGLAAHELYEGRPVDAAGEMLSGILGNFLGLGTGASTAIDVWLGKREYERSLKDNGKDPEEPKSLGKGGSGRRHRASRQPSIPLLNTPLVGPENASMYITLAKGVRMDGVHPAMRDLFYSMVSEYGSITGKTVQINSAYRIVVKPSMVNNHINRTASSRSMHAAGLAIDANHRELDEMDKLGLMRKYGFTRPIGQEPWHVEPAGIQVDLNRARTDPEWATRMIMESVGHGGGGYGTINNARHKGRDINVAKAVLKEGTSKIVTNDADKDKGTGSSKFTTGGGFGNTDISMVTVPDIVNMGTNIKPSNPAVPSSINTRPSPANTSIQQNNNTINYNKTVTDILAKSLQVQIRIAEDISSMKVMMNNTKHTVNTSTTATTNNPSTRKNERPAPVKLPEASLSLSRR